MLNNLPCILLVDDEPTNLILLEELLQLKGYNTRSAACGAEALSIARESRPDLILLDVMMPEMDGFEVCERLRQDDSLKTIPVIFITALDDDSSRLKGLEMMADDYLTKPFNSRLLLAKVENVLQLSQMRSQALSSQVRQQEKEQTKRQVIAAWEVNEYLSEKFRLFVPEQFLKRIAPQGVESIQLGNVTEEEITILFCDIRGFTAIAESQAARETFEWLNGFFTQMGACIASHRGFIDKYLGDAIMAVFDKPGFHAQDAIAAATRMLQTLQEFNVNRHQYNLKAPVKIGIGINTGIGMIGTLGYDGRMDSTVIGDVVNTASRLEGLTKIYGCPIIVSETAIAHARRAGELLSGGAGEQGENYQLPITNYQLPVTNYQLPITNYHYRWIDKTMPRGKQQVIHIYEVWTNIDVTAHGKLLTQPLFEKAIQAWRIGKLVAALGYFQQVVAQNPGDTVATLYIERCQEQLSLNQRG
ncbi:response regulator [Kamptonema formosum]|uniref:response regulator n=1 Tax=Kamptonema formosum TaxID=331992 RepID=UPI000345555D|nr:response regulator [Kamptonema formosum]